MITVTETLKEYAIERNLLNISKNELRSIGRFASHHFKNYWALNQPEGIIQDAGFIKLMEFGKPVVVAGYPDTFKDEMIKRFDVFFEEKKAKKPEDKKAEVVKQPEEKTQKKERKRIPLKAKPVKVS